MYINLVKAYCDVFKLCIPTMDNLTHMGLELERNMYKQKQKQNPIWNQTGEKLISKSKFQHVEHYPIKTRKHLAKNHLSDIQNNI